MEHIITVQVHPDGNYKMHLITKGDSSDVFDSDFPHPVSSAAWHSTYRKELNNDSNEYIWTMESKGFLHDTTFFTKKLNNTSSLRHPIIIHKKNNWFSTTYTVNQLFEGREINRKYPKFSETVLYNEKSDSINWLPEAMVYVCLQALDIIKRDSLYQTKSGLMERLGHHLKNYFVHIETNKLLAELERDREKMLKNALSPFYKILPQGFIQTMSILMEPFERELHINTGLKDDHFRYLLFVPGIIIETNADTIASDSLIWEFGLADFLNDDKKIFAKSVVYSPSKIQRIMLFSILVMCILLFILWRKTKYETI